MTDYEHLAAQYGDHYAEALLDHTMASLVIRNFDDAHPFDVPGPRGCGACSGTGPFHEHIINPQKHTLKREGDTLSCLECGESVHAPSPPKRPLTPMELSLSRFD